MQTAISLPDDVAEEAAALAARLGVSLSVFYTEALVTYCRKQGDGLKSPPKLPPEHRPKPQDLAQFYAQESSQLDPVSAQMQFASIPHEEW